MSEKKPVRYSRKQRYTIAIIVASIGIAFALYNAQQSLPYQHDKVWNFDSYQNNTVPSGFAYVQTDTEPGLWVVKADASAPSAPNILAKLAGTGSGPFYHIQLMPDGVDTINSEVSVKFKIISGEKAQAAGLVVRFEDKGHYFVLMADAMSDRFSLCIAESEDLICHVEKQAIITTGQWHTITADVSAQGIAGYLDGNKLIAEYDQHYQNGQIGLWTKEDTQASFDDLELKY